MSIKHLSLSIVAGLLFAKTAGAAVIYHDQFDRDGNLNNTSPSPVNTGGVVWKDNVQLHTTSSASGGSVSGTGGSSLLPFLPQAGFLYTLEVDVTVNTASTNWVAIGFSPDINTSPSPFSGGPTMLLRGAADGSGNWVQSFSNGLSQYSPSPGPAANAAGNLNTLRLELDTTSAAWTISSYINGTPDGTFTYSTNPTIGAVGIHWGISATYSDFEFAAVPEPSTAALLLGPTLLGLVVRRRRR